MCPPSWTPLPPPSPSHPSGLSQCTGFACPLSWIEFGLVVLCAFFFKFYLMNNKNMVVSLILKIWLFLFYVTWSHRLEYFKTFNLKWIMGDHWGAEDLELWKELSCDPLPSDNTGYNSWRKALNTPCTTTFWPQLDSWSKIIVCYHCICSNNMPEINHLIEQGFYALSFTNNDF